MTVDTLTLAELARRDLRFFNKVSPGYGECGCWLWVGSKTHQGYGRVTRNYKSLNAHRWAYQLLVGPIPEGLTLDHLCGNPSCVRPDHLEPTTLRENILRGNGIGVKNAAKTHCKHGHEFTPENTYLNAGKRHCRECGRRTTAAWHEKRRKEAAK